MSEDGSGLQKESQWSRTNGKIGKHLRSSMKRGGAMSGKYGLRRKSARTHQTRPKDNGHEDYLRIHFWLSSAWDKFGKLTNLEMSIMQVSRDSDDEETTVEGEDNDDKERKALYLENQFSNTISKKRLLREGHASTKWGAKTADVAAFYYREMGLHCFEAERLATNSYSQWYKSPARKKTRSLSHAGSK
ncbi:hypothetical protein BKA93DRAFT_751637 [Sparassis latifolia]